jgi:hypothetical protein
MKSTEGSDKSHIREEAELTRRVGLPSWSSACMPSPVRPQHMRHLFLKTLNRLTRRPAGSVGAPY